MVPKKVRMLCEQTSRINVYIKYQQISMSCIQAGTGIDEKIRRINQRKEKYKRSTNNSHKKFICVARKLLYKLCTYRERELFQKEFEPYQNSRVYYFIILSHVKIRMTVSQRENFKRNLTALLNAKVHTYNEEIRRTNNKNFINFRFEEIADIQFALKALILYLDNKVEEAIEVIYKKEKGFVLKKQQFEMAISIVGQLEERLKSYPEGQLFPYFHERQKKSELVKEKSAATGGRSRKVEDEEWVQEKNYRQSSKNSTKRQKRKEISIQIKIQSQAEKNPLLFLEKSYPINPHFYSVLFSYPDPEISQPFPTASYPTYSIDSNFHLKFPQNMEKMGSHNLNFEAANEEIPRNTILTKIKRQEIPFNFQHISRYDHSFSYDMHKKQLTPPKPTGVSVQKSEDDDDYSNQI